MPRPLFPGMQATQKEKLHQIFRHYENIYATSVPEFPTIREGFLSEDFIDCKRRIFGKRDAKHQAAKRL